MKKLLSLVLLISLIFLPNSSSKAESNLAINPGFENFNSKQIELWDTSSYEEKGEIIIDESVKYSGNASVKITNPEDTDTRVQQTISVEPDSIYEFTCWVKTKGIQNNGLGANISFFNLLVFSSDLKGTHDWSQLKIYGKTNNDQKQITYTLGVGGYGQVNSGIAWFDDVTVKKLSEAPAGETVYNLFTDVPPQNDSENTGGGFGKIIIMLFIVLLLSGVVYFMLTKYNNKNADTKDKFDKSAKSTKMPSEAEVKEPYKIKLKLKDFLIMGIATLLYSVIAIVNLGSMMVPETGWEAERIGDSIIIDLPEEIQTKRVGLYYGYGIGKYRIKYFDKETNKYVPFSTVDKKLGQIFKWEYFNGPVIQTDKFKIIVDKGGALLNEIAFYDTTNQAIDVSQASISSSTDSVSGNLKALIDEQDKVAIYNSYTNSTYFDEIYHARTAYENINELEVYEWTHPPLGKLFIAIGIDLFGMNPFGWRIIGTLFGILMLPIMYLFGLKLFKKRFFAFASMWLLAVDFMHFSQSRISTIDIYGTFFVLLMYYFIYDYFTYKSINMNFKKSLIALLLCGITFGIGSASKWISIYAGGGLAVLFFTTKIQEYLQWKRVTYRWKGNRTGWVKDFVDKYIVKTILWAILSFVIIPVIIYSASYIPSYLDVPGEDVSKIWKNQVEMFDYHSKSVLDSTHPFSSRWYDWPTIKKPLLVYQGSDIPQEKQGGIYRAFVKEPDKQPISSTIVIMGNPAIYWLGLVFLPIAIYLAISRKDRGMAVVFIAMAFQFVPWMFVERLTFFYHFFSSVPFLIFSIVYVFKCYFEDNPKMGYYALGTYLLVCTVLFLMFYPVLSGYEVPRSYVDNYLMWFKSKTNFKWHF